MNREQRLLDTLESEGNLRSLCNMAVRGPYIYDLGGDGRGSVLSGRRYYNLSSNDYLGIAGDTALQREFLSGLDTDRYQMGNPASRSMTGNSGEYAELETALAIQFEAPAALVLGSGYAVNSGVLAAVTQPGDVVLADRLVHASIVDGLRLCQRGVEWERYRHNDMEHLEHLLSKARRARRGERSELRIIVATESLFSMDGDFAPLDQLAELQREYDFLLYLDEAHAFGVYGYRNNGAGLLAAYNARNRERVLRGDYIVATFGKALAGQGAAVICSAQTRALLINRLRPLIFSTALPPISLAWTKFLIEKLPEFGDRRSKLRELVHILEHKWHPDVPISSQIIPIMAEDNLRALEMMHSFRAAGFWTTAIRYPTVPKGQARLRISVTASHDRATIETFGELCKQYF